MPQQIFGNDGSKDRRRRRHIPKCQEKKHWYVAVVNNRSEKACQDRLRKRLKNETDSEKAYEVYVPIQQEMSIRHDGKRKKSGPYCFPCSCVHSLHRFSKTERNSLPSLYKTFHG